MTPNTKLTFKLIQFIGLVVFLIGIIAMAAVWKSDIEFKVNHNTEVIQEHDATLNKLLDVTVEIKTDVKWLIQDAKEE